MVKLNGITLAPLAVFCGIVNAAESYVDRRLTLNVADVWDRAFRVTADCVNIRGFAATMETGKW